jgi:hypothetical protein
MQVDHLKQLKALMGDAVQLTWRPPSSGRSRRAATATKDLDLSISFVIPVDSGRPSGHDAYGQSQSASSIPSASDVSVVPLKCQSTLSDACEVLQEPSPAPQSFHAPKWSPSLRQSTIRAALLRQFANHIFVADPALDPGSSPEKPPDIFKLVACPKYDAAAVPPLPEAPLPSRPTYMNATSNSSASRSATPVRAPSGSLTQHLLTPSPSIRRATAISSFLPPLATATLSPTPPTTPLPSRSHSEQPPAPRICRGKNTPSTCVQHDRPVAIAARRLHAAAMSAVPPSPCTASGFALTQTPAKLSLAAPVPPLKQTPFQTPSKRKRASESPTTSETSALAVLSSKTPISTLAPYAHGAAGQSHSCTSFKTPRSAVAPSGSAANGQSPSCTSLRTPCSRATSVLAATVSPNATPTSTSRRVGVCQSHPPCTPSPSPASRSTFYEAPPRFLTKGSLFDSTLPHVSRALPTRSSTSGEVRGHSRTPMRVVSGDSSALTLRSPHCCAHTTPKSSTAVASAPSLTSSKISATTDVTTRRKLSFLMPSPPLSPMPSQSHQTPLTSPCKLGSSLQGAGSHIVGDAPLSVTRSKAKSSFARPRRPAAEAAVAAAAALVVAAEGECLTRSPKKLALAAAVQKMSDRPQSDARVLAASIMDDEMFKLLRRNADENATARQAQDKTAVRLAVEKVCLKGFVFLLPVRASCAPRRPHIRSTHKHRLTRFRETARPWQAGWGPMGPGHCFDAAVGNFRV